MEGPRERRRRRGPQRAGRELRSLRRTEAADHDLVEPARPAKAGAHPPERVAAADLIAAVRAEDQQRLVRRPRGKRGQELEGRRVGPMEVVQEHDRRSAPHDRLQARRGWPRPPSPGRRPAAEPRARAGGQTGMASRGRTRRARADRRGAGRAARRRQGRTERVPAPARSRAGGAAPRRAAPPPRGASCRHRPRPRAERSRRARRAGEPAPPRARPVPARGPRVRAVRWLPTSSAFAGHPLGTGDAMPTSWGIGGRARDSLRHVHIASRPPAPAAAGGSARAARRFRGAPVDRLRLPAPGLREPRAGRPAASPSAGARRRPSTG